MKPGEYIGQAVVAAIDATRAIRPATRAGERFFRAGLRFRASAEGWSDEERREWMLRRLRAVVRRAAWETPFYRARFRDAGFDPESDFTFDDYARLPVLEREEIAEGIASMIVERVPPEVRRLDGTGGSTGVPLQYWSGPEERGWRVSGQVHFMRRLGVPRGVRTAFLWGHHIDQRERTQWRERLRDAVTNRRWYDCFRLSPELLLQYHEDLKGYRPACLTAYASALDSLAEVLLAKGLRADYPTTRIITGGEKLWAHQRARVEAAFEAPLHEQYGSREAGLIGMQLDPRKSLAFSVDFANAFVEPAASGGEDDILVTKLHADAMPMLRYRIGDVARFPASSRPGHPSFELDEILGRRLDRLVLPGGRWLHGIGIPHLMKDFPLRQFQVRQNADYTVDVLVVPNGVLGEADERRIGEVMGRNLPGLAVRVVRVPEIARTSANKWRPVVSLVDAGNAAAPLSPAS